jgi:hypothetical protein
MNVAVRGRATAEELAAVLAVLAVPGAVPPQPSRYEQWRATRQRAMRHRVVGRWSVDRPI